MENHMPRLPAFLISLGLFLTFTSNVCAEGKGNGIYVGGIAGSSLRMDTALASQALGTEPMEFHPGYTFGGVLGYDFGNNLRMEGEISYRENQIRTGGGEDPQAATSGMMFNGFYDVLLTKPLYLYVGGGLGVATAQLKTISLGQSINTSETAFAYQLEAGFSYNIRPNVNFSLGYRFFDAADPKFVLPAGQRVQMELENHEFILKMRYLFNL
jgi:opacity protein-like surface antigen